MPLNHSNKYSELTPDQFQLIGKVIIEFSNIEFLTGIILSRLLMTPEYLGRTYTDQMNFSDRINAIKNALAIHVERYSSQIISKELTDEIKSVIDNITSIRSYRNYFSHYCWMRTNDNEIFGTPLSGRLPALNRQNKDSLSLSNKKIQNIYSKAYKILDDVWRLVDKLPEIEESLEVAKKLHFKSQK